MNRKTILVTWDFTLLSEYALAHAINLSKVVDNDIIMIHVVKKKDDINPSKERLRQVADQTKQKQGIGIEVMVQEGTIFSTIGKAASEVNASLVIMGTHGIKGLQKLTGSWALKVIASAKVPFIVVQEPPKKDSFDNIVLPVDFRIENKDQMNWVNYLSTYYKSKFYLFKENITDSILKKQISNNLIFTKKMFDSKGINYEIVTASGSGSFPDETIRFAREIKADLILVMTTRNIGFRDYILGANEQQIIANHAKIPVMCINPGDHESEK